MILPSVHQWRAFEWYEPAEGAHVRQHTLLGSRLLPREDAEDGDRTTTYQQVCLFAFQKKNLSWASHFFKNKMYDDTRKIASSNGN